MKSNSCFFRITFLRDSFQRRFENSIKLKVLTVPYILYILKTCMFNISILDQKYEYYLTEKVCSVHNTPKILHKLKLHTKVDKSRH